MNIITCFEVVGHLKCSLTSATKHQVFLCSFDRSPSASYKCRVYFLEWGKVHM